jgi:hypothetical protein
LIDSLATRAMMGEATGLSSIGTFRLREIDSSSMRTPSSVWM